MGIKDPKAMIDKLRTLQGLFRKDIKQADFEVIATEITKQFTDLQFEYAFEKIKVHNDRFPVMKDFHYWARQCPKPGALRASKHPMWIREIAEKLKKPPEAFQDECGRYSASLLTEEEKKTLDLPWKARLHEKPDGSYEFLFNEDAERVEKRRAGNAIEKVLEKVSQMAGGNKDFPF